MAIQRNGKRFGGWTPLFGILAVLGSSLVAAADEPAPPKPPEPARKSRTAPSSRAAVTDQFDNPVPKLAPKRPLTPEEKKRKDALAWFMSGRLKKAESRFTEAMNDYQTAVKLDPTAVEVYRELVPLAFALNQTEEGLKYAQEAIKLDPYDLDILRILAEHLQEQQKLDKAAEYLDQATKVPALKRDSATYVLLHLQLAALYAEMTRVDRGNFDKGMLINKAADAYTVVLDARRNPTKYNLDFQTRAALDRERLARFEFMGEIFLLANRPHLAVLAFEQAAKPKNGHPGPINFNLAQAYFLDKNYDSAMRELQVYLDAQLQGKGREPYELLAKILKATGKANALLARIEDLAKNDARNSTLQYFLADQYIAAGRIKEGEDLIHRVLKQTGDSEGYVGLAALYERQNQPAELLQALAKALKGVKERRAQQRLDEILNRIQKNAGLVDGIITTARNLDKSDKTKLDFFTAYIVGRLAIGAHRYDDAVKFYLDAMQGRPEAQARLGFELAREHLMPAKRYQQAVEVLKRAVSGRMPPGEAGEGVKVELMALLAQAQEFAGKTSDSLATIREAQKLASDEPKLHYWEAWIYSHSHQWDDAIRQLSQLVKKYSSDKEKAGFVRLCQYTLSNCYVQKGDISAGERILESVLKEEPNDPSVNNDLGYLYADQGKHLERAEKMIRLALNSEPDNIAYVDSMGWILFKRGKLAEARSYLEKAVKNPSGSDATIWDHLGDCYDRLKLPDKAVEAWQHALKDARAEPFPDQKLIERLREKLKQNVAEGKK